MTFLVFFTVSYLLGSIPFGLILAKAVKGIDIREHGSKNIGATNVFRVIGKKWGILVFILDAVKGLVAVLIPVIFSFEFFPPQNILIGIAAILGHSFPVWLSFKGGKGVATSFGVFLALAFLPCIIAFAVFSIAFALTRILSIGSLTAAIAFPILVWILYSSKPGFVWYLGVSAALCAFIFYTHRPNIARLLKGEEKKLI